MRVASRCSCRAGAACATDVEGSQAGLFVGWNNPLPPAAARAASTRVPCPPVQAVPAGLFQRLGGQDGLAAIFDSWLCKAQADWRVRRFLEGAQEDAARAQMVGSAMRVCCKPDALCAWHGPGPTRRALLCPYLQGQWLCAALGGPIPYHGPDPAALCTRLIEEKGLNSTHLDTLAQHLAGSMSEQGIPAVRASS